MSGVTESARLSKLVADFGEAMRRKLWKKQPTEGGWDDITDSTLEEHLREQLTSCFERFQVGDNEQLVDIANLAAMIWNLIRLEEQERARHEARRK